MDSGMWSKSTTKPALARTISMDSVFLSKSTIRQALARSRSKVSAFWSKSTTSQRLARTRSKESALLSKSFSRQTSPRSTCKVSDSLSESTRSRTLTRTKSLESSLWSKSISSLTSPKSRSKASVLQAIFADVNYAGKDLPRSRSMVPAFGSTSMESAFGPRFASSRSLQSAFGPRFASSRSLQSAFRPRFASSRSLQSAFSSISISSQTSAKFRSKVSDFFFKFTTGQRSAKSRSKESGNVVVQKMTLMSEGQNPINVDLTGDLTLIKEKPIVIKEGAMYQILVKFLVRGTKVKGLRYKQVISRMGIKADKSVFVFGNFKPKAEPYNYVTTIFEAPKGRLGRGHYKVKSKIIDNNKIVHLKWKWILHVKEE